VTDPLAPFAQYHLQEERANNTMTLVDAGGNNTLDLRQLVGSYSFELNTTIEAGASSRVDFNSNFSTIFAADLVQGETGEIFGSERAEKIYGGSGIDILSGGGGEDEIDGGAGSDLIQLTDAKSIFWGGGDDLLLIGWRENHQSWSNVTDNYIDLSAWDLTSVTGFEGISIGQGLVKLTIADILAVRQGSSSTSPFLIEAREGGRLDLDITDFVKEVGEFPKQSSPAPFSLSAGGDLYRSISHPELQLAISKEIVLV
jgi:Ca2+-binding RTX toxin-like protein